MRQIKFRGKLINSDEWLYGGYYQASTGENRIITVDATTGTITDWNVQPDTIGQFSGLFDKNGKEIYEGDIIHLNDEEFELEYGNGIVMFLEKDDDGSPCGGLWYLEDADEGSNTENSLYDLWYQGELEIIGNIHDNPELLKESRNHVKLD